MLKLKLKLK